jgi:predicted DNA-binding transcriptional regulator AlpA
MSKFKTIEEVPVCMTVDDVKDFLGIAKPNAYILVNRADFPKLKIERRIIIPKHAFINWLDRQVESGEVINL